MSQFPIRLKEIRDKLGLTQKSFSELLNIPQGTISSYESGKYSPSIDVLLEISNRLEVSMDWLAGRTPSFSEITGMNDLVNFFYEIGLIENLNPEFIIVDKLANDLESEDTEWEASIRFKGNSKEAPLNADICNILREVSENLFDLESYTITMQQYETQKSDSSNYYSQPLKRKEFEVLPRAEALKKRAEYYKKHKII